MPDPALHEAAELYATRGGAVYGGEAVSQLEHALQTAALAEAEGASDHLIAAALLHDIGHLVVEREPATPHEQLGDRLLLALFGEEVVGPARLHVAAKRYLCAAELGYRDGLSPASVASLALQGGPMTPAETAAFERGPHFAAVVRLRRWDDAAKVPGLVTPPFAHFLPVLERCRASR